MRELSSPRVDQSASRPVRELAIRELAYPRVVQLPRTAIDAHAFDFLTAGSPSSRYGAVAAAVVRRLRQLGAAIRYVGGGIGGRRLAAPMMWRFTVVDDADVDVFVVRDADGRLTARDAAAVADWLRRRPETTAIFHCIRDHPSHSNSFVSGGLWGARRRELFAHLNGR